MSFQNITVSHQIKNHLEHQIHTIVSQPELFAKSPLDFSRNRKLSFGGKSLASELLSLFDFSPQTPNVPAFVQARNKIKIEAFEQLFYQTIPSGAQDKCYKGYQLLAHDGSDINIPYNEKDPDTHHIAGKWGRRIGQLHLNALYDPLNKSYQTIDIQKSRKVNERQSLCQMVDQFNFSKPTIILADRGYESFNVFEHIKKSGQRFLIRVKDTQSNSFLKAIGLPSEETFDTKIKLHLTRSQTNKAKVDQHYQLLRKTANFDYLPPQAQGIYPLGLIIAERTIFPLRTFLSFFCYFVPLRVFHKLKEFHKRLFMRLYKFLYVFKSFYPGRISYYNWIIILINLLLKK